MPDFVTLNFSAEESDPSPFLRGTREFGSPARLWLVDLYGGRLPRGVEWQQIAILDSNVVSGLHALATNTHKDNPAHLIEFIEFLVSGKWTLTPRFFLTESSVKGRLDNHKVEAERKLLSIARVACADVSKLKGSGTIATDNDAVERFLADSGHRSLQEWARAEVAAFLALTPAHVQVTVDLSYASILKMVLIQSADVGAVEDRFTRFLRFMADEPDALGPLELVLAQLYFARLSGRFLGVQASMGAEKALKAARRTAWDLYLLRWSQTFTAVIPGRPTMLGFIATQESELASFSDAFSVERLSVLAAMPSSWVNMPLPGIHVIPHEALVASLGNTAVDKMRALVMQEQDARRARHGKRDASRVPSVIEQLERELRAAYAPK